MTTHPQDASPNIVHTPTMHSMPPDVELKINTHLLLYQD
jgi:hypothetical protein